MSSACGQLEASERIAADPSLLYLTRAAAVREGLHGTHASDEWRAELDSGI